MEARLQRLENDIAALREDVAIVRSNVLTKADLNDCANRLITWIVGTGLAAFLATVTTMALEVAHLRAEILPGARVSAIVIVPYPAQPPSNQK